MEIYVQNFRFWNAPPQEEFYIVKQKKGHSPLTGNNAVCAHIANQIYRLLGIYAPNLYIGYYQDNLSLISQVLPRYKDLAEWLDGKNPLKIINQQNNIDGCIAAYKNCEKKLLIDNKEALLAAAIILEDCDVIGASFRNIGLIEENGKHTIIKIDPDESIFNPSYLNTDSVLKEFENQLSVDNPLLYKIFSIDRVYNNPNCILGNLHLKEFFHNIDQQELR